MFVGEDRVEAAWRVRNLKSTYLLDLRRVRQSRHIDHHAGETYVGTARSELEGGDDVIPSAGLEVMNIHAPTTQVQFLILDSPSIQDGGFSRILQADNVKARVLFPRGDVGVGSGQLLLDLDITRAIFRALGDV